MRHEAYLEEGGIGRWGGGGRDIAGVGCLWSRAC